MERQPSGACIHRWVLGEPTLETVSGVCRRCGARRTYPSALEHTGAVTDYEELDRNRLRASLEAKSREEEPSLV